MRFLFDFRIVRNWGMVIMLFILVAGNLYAQNVSVKDYKIPVSFANRFIIDFSANHATKGSDTTTSKGNVGGVYKSFYDSPSYGSFLDVIGSGLLDKNIAKDEYRKDYKVDGSLRFKKYLLVGSERLKDLFASARFNTSMVKSFDQPATAVTVGVGYGRFIDATALAKAVRIEEFLIREGELTGHLPKEAILKLSSIIQRRGEYEDRFGDAYKDDWYNDMEETLSDSGMLTEDTLGAIGTLRIEEVLEREKIADRFYGWDATLGTKFDITLPYDNQDRPPGNLDVSANYARPISWRLQLNERFSMTTPFDNIVKSFLASLSSDLSYELSNRVDLRLRHLFNMDKPEEGDSKYSNAFGISLIYYIENYINIVATEQIEKTPGEETTTNFTVSLNYRVF